MKIYFDIPDYCPDCKFNYDTISCKLYDENINCDLEEKPSYCTAKKCVVDEE